MMIGIFQALLETLEVGLRIWEHKEKTKYQEKISKLRIRISDEEAKDIYTRDQNVIDRAHRDLVFIAREWAAAVTGQDSVNKP